jgi:hypothetical protein
VNSSLVNIAANLPKIGIPLTPVGHFQQCRPALNPPKDIFSIRIHPFDPADYMLPEKLLKGVNVDMFASENGCRGQKSATQSARIPSFHSSAITSGPGCHLGAFSSKDEAPTGAGARADL